MSCVGNLFICTIYHRLATEARNSPFAINVTARTEDFYNRPAFSPARTYGLIFADEVAEVRNPETDIAIAIQRLVQQSRAVIGVTATPMFNGFKDYINICRVLRLPAVLRRSEASAQRQPLQPNQDNDLLLFDKHNKRSSERKRESGNKKGKGRPSLDDRVEQAVNRVLKTQQRYTAGLVFGGAEDHLQKEIVG
ncbi:uncharacterized protein L201_008003 [Kwoniella dendrophila CBS 6074]|uniref:Helicase ATP-binding domain-containing protein n=1 Tax=Kwoniella dendrophila CBS 6074 TaxID=1295534 RepID=A0AAX4K7B8_9TREE